MFVGVIWRRCLFVAVVLWPMCCHTRIPCRRHITWHSTLSQYTDTGPTCRYPLLWNVTLEYTATHFNVLGWTPPGNPSPIFHTHQRTLNLNIKTFFCMDQFCLFWISTFISIFCSWMSRSVSHLSVHCCISYLKNAWTFSYKWLGWLSCT